MSKLVCHMGKYVRSNVFGLQKHNQRENKNYSNENVDLDKSHLNYDLANEYDIKYLDKVDMIVKNNRTNTERAVRKDAVVFVDTVVSSDNDFFNNLSDQDIRRFFEESYKYLQEKVGKKNIVSSMVHMDENTPHMHFSFVPINEDGSLSAKKKINRNFLREVQDEFPKYLQIKGFNIKRGLENSLKKHLEPLEFKKSSIMKEIERTNVLESRVRKTAESLYKLEEHIKGLTGKLDKIEVKKGLFSDKLTISEQDYSTLINLAKAGEGKYLENLQLKAKIGELERKLDSALHKKSINDELKDIKLKRLESIDIKYRKLNKDFTHLEKAINNLDEGTIDTIIKSLKEVVKAEKAISRNSFFEMER